MKKFLVAAAALCAAAGAAMGGVVATAAPNNGSGGVFVDLTAGPAALSVTSFATYITGTAGTARSIEVWTRPGSYVGNTGSNAGWTLSETVAATSAGTAVLSAHFALANPIAIGAGQTTAVYFHSITSGGGIRYNGTSAAPPVTTYTNGEITLFSDVARTGAVSFAGTANTPRTFSGEIAYDVVPAPASLALVGLGGLVAGRRRR
jgi:hypothetical protein